MVPRKELDSHIPASNVVREYHQCSLPAGRETCSTACSGLTASLPFGAAPNTLSGAPCAGRFTESCVAQTLMAVDELSFS